MNNAALAKALEHANQLDPDCSPPLQAPPTAHDSSRVPRPPSVVLPLPPSAAPRGFIQSLWLRLFGPPPIDPSTISRDFGSFRAFYEMGADYLPSSGTWPTSDRS